MPVYSPLCDTDAGAYAAYLASVVDGNDDAGGVDALPRRGLEVAPTIGGDVGEPSVSFARDSPFAAVLHMCLRRSAGRGLGCARLDGAYCVPSGARRFVGDDGDDDGRRGVEGRSLAIGSVEYDLDATKLGSFVQGVEFPRRSVVGGSGRLGRVDDGAAEERRCEEGDAGVEDLTVVGACGPNVVRNRARREKKKRRLARRRSAVNPVSLAVDGLKAGSAVPLAPTAVDRSADPLRASLEAKRVAENRLAEAQAKRRLAVLEANDIESEVRRYRTRVSAMTEQNMVSIERTHAKLRKTGNLPAEGGGGFAETVVSGGSDGLTGGDTISPNSSASMADYRRCQKSLLDSEARVKELTAALERFGVSVEHLDKYDKSVWTCDEENLAILDEMYDEYAFQAVPDDDVHVRLLGRGGSRGVREQPEDHMLRKCDGELYSGEEAMRWLGKFAFLGARLDQGVSDEAVAASLSQPMEVVVKYRALRAKFLGDTLV